MTWSPRQLAELAGVSVKAIRYYHDIRVLAEPERATNGYRQYTFAHLLRLLQIKRLTDLGVPLSQIPEVDRSDRGPAAVLRAVQAEVGEAIGRLQRVQSELAALIEHGGPVDVPPGFEAVAQSLSESDRSMLLVWARVLDDQSMDALRGYLGRLPRSAAEDAFDALAPDAPEEQVARTLELLAARSQDLEPVRPTLRDRYGTGPSRWLLTEAFTELYNPAQREVLRRLEQPGA